MRFTSLMVLSGLLGLAACSSSPTEPNTKASVAEQPASASGGGQLIPQGCPQLMGSPQICGGRN